MINAKIKKVVCSLSAAALALSVASFAYSETTYKPAMFDFTGSELSAKLDASIVSATAAVLYCQSDVGVKGNVSVSHCYDQSSDPALARGVERALTGMNFTPASVDGNAVPVRVSYRVVFTGKTTELIPNLGTMQSRYGRDYIAPQERLDVSDWYAKYSDDSWVNGDVFLGEGELSRVAATVTEEGKPAVVRTIDAKRGYQRDATIVRNALKRSRFIPGFVEDKPVSMGYVAVVNYGNSNEAVSSR